MLEKEGPCLF